MHGRAAGGHRQVSSVHAGNLQCVWSYGCQRLEPGHLGPDGISSAPPEEAKVEDGSWRSQPQLRRRSCMQEAKASLCLPGCGSFLR